MIDSRKVGRTGWIVSLPWVFLMILSLLAWAAPVDSQTEVAVERIIGQSLASSFAGWLIVCSFYLSFFLCLLSIRIKVLKGEHISTLVSWLVPLYVLAVSIITYLTIIVTIIYI